MDQWRPKSAMGKCLINSTENGKGNFIEPSNNADAFFVIE